MKQYVIVIHRYSVFFYWARIKNYWLAKSPQAFKNASETIVYYLVTFKYLELKRAFLLVCNSLNFDIYQEPVINDKGLITKVAAIRSEFLYMISIIKNWRDKSKI